LIPALNYLSATPRWGRQQLRERFSTFRTKTDILYFLNYLSFKTFKSSIIFPFLGRKGSSGLWGLRVCLAVTLAAALSVYTLLTVMFLHLLGCLSILSAASLIVSSVIAQLAIAPRIINAALKVRELKPEEFQW